MQIRVRELRSLHLEASAAIQVPTVGRTVSMYARPSMLHHRVPRFLLSMQCCRFSVIQQTCEEQATEETSNRRG